MSRTPSIVGIAIDTRSQRILSHVGSLGEVRTWADEVRGEGVVIDIREIGNLVMLVQGEKS